MNLSTILIALVILTVAETTLLHDNHLSEDSSASMTRIIRQKQRRLLENIVVASSANYTSEYQTLRDFYYATGGPHWTSGNDWLSDTSYCTWSGVTCGPNGNVGSLSLDSFGLRGQIPESIGNFGNLTSIRNYLSGALPTTICNVQSLASIVIQYNFLSGSLPSCLGLMPQLSLLSLGFNSLSGSLPDSLGNAHLLTLLSLSNNYFDGPIPSSFGNMTNMGFLVLNNNQLSGTIPATLSQLSKLQFLFLQSNYFSGSIPDAFAGLFNLQQIDLSSNKLSGVLPSFFNSATYWIQNNVNVLNFAYNELTGVIPSFVLQFPAVLKLSNNQFTELAPVLAYTIDVGFAFYIDVSSNALSGTIPEYLGNVSPALSYVDVSNNPMLQTTCSTLLFQEASSCFAEGSFLSINANETVVLGSNSICESISAIRNGLTVRADPSYLQYRQCYCVPNYFRALNGSSLGAVMNMSTTELAMPPRCLTCETNDLTLANPCTCEFGIVRGCYPVPFHSEWQAVVPCPRIGRGFTACNPLPSNSSGAPVPSSSASSVPFACAAGYTDRLCTRCEVGYFVTSRSCLACPTPNFIKSVIPIAFIVFLVLGIIFLLNVSAGIFGMLEIFLFYVQSSLVLVNTSGLSWPSGFSTGVTAVSAIGGFSLQALECVFDGISLPAIYAIYFLIPIIILGTIFGIYLVGVAIMRVIPSYSLKKWPERCKYAAIYLLQSLYFNVAVKTFQLFGCTLRGGPSEYSYYLTAIPWVACDVSVAPYSSLFAMGLLSLVFYVIGIPLLMAVLLWKHYDEREDERVMTMMGFLYAAYRKKLWWWKFVILLRRVSLAIILGSIPFTSPNVAVWAVLVILQVAIFLQHALLPYRTKLENWMELVSLYILTISFLGAYIQAEIPDDDPSYWILIVLIVVLVLFGVVLLGFTIFTYVAIVAGRMHELMPSVASTRGGQALRSTTIRLERRLFDLQEQRKSSTPVIGSGLDVHLLDDDENPGL